MSNSSLIPGNLYPKSAEGLSGKSLSPTVISSSLKYFGNGGIPLTSLSQSGATTDQAIVWDGSKWAPGTPTASVSPSGNNTFTGLNKFIGGIFYSFTTMTGSVIDVTKAGNLYTNTASTSTVSYSISNPTESYCTFFRVETGSVDRTITIPSTYSIYRGSSITSLFVPAGSVMQVRLQYLSARWEIINDPIPSTGTGSLVLSNGASISLENAINLPLATAVSGTLGIANGGTGAQTAAQAIQSLTSAARTIPGSFIIDWSTGSLHKITLSQNTTFTFSNTVDGQTINSLITNTAGNYTVAWPTAKWQSGSVPTQTTGSKSDLWEFTKVGTEFFGSVIQNYS